ncbi:MAG TPA: hypothetical protein VHW72_03415 [Candidatus Angelobacter sp.]|jgi:hypothetical protein|nr:hypothetical protein [Candidatus Angelobacter sp.]
MTITTRQQRFKDLLRRHSDFGRDGLRRQIVGVNLVFAQFVLHAHGLKQSDGVGFHFLCRSALERARPACAPSPMRLVQKIPPLADAVKRFGAQRHECGLTMRFASASFESLP